MRKFRLMISMICVLILLLGCQPTPERPPVIYRGNDYLKNNSSERPNWDVTNHLNYSVDMNGLLISYDSDVVIPEIKSYSIVEIEKESFSQKDFGKYIDYFSPDNSELLAANTLTKRQIAELIVDLEEASSEKLSEDLAELVIDELNTLFETAPNEIDENQLLFSLKDVNSGESFNTFTLSNEGNYSQYSGTMDGNSFFYIKNSYTVANPQSIYSEHDPEWSDYDSGFTLSEEVAKENAKQVLVDLGIDNMEIANVEKACAYHYYKAQTVVTKGWRVVFTRNSNGLPSIYTDVACLWNTSDAPALGAPWDQEVIFVTVDEAGIYCFDWRGAGKQKKVLQENAELLPLEDILDRAEKQLMYQHLPQNNEKADFSITVKKISLDSALVNVANETNIGRMIPVWDFYYDIVYKEGEASAMEPYVLTLNAIDGRYIEPRITKNTIEEVSTGN